MRAIGLRLVGLTRESQESVPFQPFDWLDVEGNAGITAEVVVNGSAGALVDHGHGIVVFHSLDAVVASRCGVGGVVDRLRGIMNERLLECGSVRGIVFAVRDEEVHIDVDPSLEQDLADVGASGNLFEVVAALNALGLLVVERGKVREFLGASAKRECVLVADGGTGDFVEPIGIGAILGA